MMIWLIVVLAVWLVVVGHGLVQLRGWIESAQADIEVQLAHRNHVVRQSASRPVSDTLGVSDTGKEQQALARAEQALAGARRYHSALIAEYNHKLALPPGPLVGRVARLARWPVSDTLGVSDTGRNVLRWNA